MGGVGRALGGRWRVVRVRAGSQNLCTFYVFQKMNLLPLFFYSMVVIGSLTMVGNGAGVGGVGTWEGVVRALGGR